MLRNVFRVTTIVCIVVILAQSTLGGWSTVYYGIPDIHQTTSRYPQAQLTQYGPQYQSQGILGPGPNATGFTDGLIGKTSDFGFIEQSLPSSQDFITLLTLFLLFMLSLKPKRPPQVVRNTTRKIEGQRGTLYVCEGPQIHRARTKL